jgi:hypothetical protein
MAIILTAPMIEIPPELCRLVPLSTTRAEEIDELREWAKTRAVPASAIDAAAASQ